MVDIPKILKYIVTKSGMEQERFGESIGLKKAAFNNYIQGRRELPKSVITNLMKVHQINPAVFFDEGAPVYISDILKPTNIIEVSQRTVRIPVLGKIACGDPILAEANYEDYRTELEDRLPAGRLFYLEAKGDSMAPEITSGSMVLLREQYDVENGEIAAVMLNGNEEATLKKIKKQDGMIILMPVNPNYEPIFVTKDNTAQIIGKVIRSERIH